MRPEDARSFLEVHRAAVHGIASRDYPPDVIDAWAPIPITDDAIAEVLANRDREIRLVAERDGAIVGMGALVVENSELRACYVSPHAGRQGVGTAIAAELERLARHNGLVHLTLESSITAEPLYTRLGYEVLERGEHVLRSGVRMAAVKMRKALASASQIDWGRTSQDYSTWRPNYPDRFFNLLTVMGLGLHGQRILDLGTGVGFLAAKFAQAGAIVTAVDISPEQITEARRRAEALGVRVDFLVAAAEDTSLPSGSFDVITASQSWLYFDKARMIPEVKRLLAPHGRLMTSHLCWLPREDAIAEASERLVLQHNPHWTGSDLTGDVPTMPAWAVGHFELDGMFVFDERLEFTRESWRGRIRACRGVGASMTPAQVEVFDREHDALLRSTTPEQFSILHRVDAHILRPARTT